jgi:hypothetical protein
MATIVARELREDRSLQVDLAPALARRDAGRRAITDAQAQALAKEGRQSSGSTAVCTRPKSSAQQLLETVYQLVSLQDGKRSGF